jgi:uncharacterized RDD family membrane protein YckC
VLGLRVTDGNGQRLGWKAAVIRFAASAWGLFAWAALASVIFLVHRHEHVAFEIDRLTWRQVALPVVYTSLAAAVFIAYLGGFLLAAFHPQRRALHDLLSGSEVRRAR